MQALVPYLIRIIAAWITGALFWLSRKAGVDYSMDELHGIALQVAQFILEKGIPLGTTVYALVKISLDKFFNKGNASTAPLVESHNAESNKK